jgi:hypothetical protein
MSAFYDQASLVVVPSGYKSGKIYAQKPLTTDGQLTFTRASTATRVNASGLIETVASGVPRLDYLDSTCPKLLLEPQRTNLVQYSEQFNNAWWAGSGSVTANTATAPDGTISADTNNPTGVYPAAAGVGDATIVNTASIFAKANPSGASTMVLTLNKYGTGDAIVCTFNLTTGTAGAVTLGGSAVSGTAKIENYGNGWYRCILTGVASTSAGALSLSPANNCFIWGAQLEAGAYATSYIPTLGTSVTRVIDNTLTSGLSGSLPQTAGTLFWDFEYTYGASSTMLIHNTGLSDYGFCQVSTGGLVEGGIYESGTMVERLVKSGGIATGRHKIAFAYETNSFALYVDGVLADSGTSGSTASISMDTISLDWNISDFTRVNQALLFKTRLTNAQLAELTSL